MEKEETTGRQATRAVGEAMAAPIEGYFHMKKGKSTPFHFAVLFSSNGSKNCSQEEVGTAANSARDQQVVLRVRQ